MACRMVRTARIVVTMNGSLRGLTARRMSSSASTSCAAGSIALPERYAVRRRIANGGMASVWCAEDRMLGRRWRSSCWPSVRPRRVRGPPLQARGARRGPALGPPARRHDLRRRRDDRRGDPRRRPRVHRHGVPGRRHRGRRAAGGAVTPRRGAALAARGGRRARLRPRRGVVHRDIKPANLLLDREPGAARRRLRDRPDRHRGHDHRAGAAARHRRLSCPRAGARPPGHRGQRRYALAVAAFELLRASARSAPSTSPPRPASTSRTSRRGPASATRAAPGGRRGAGPRGWPSSPRTLADAPARSSRPSSVR